MHRGGGYGGRGYGGYYNSPFNTFINLSDLFFYWDPYYSRRQRMRQRASTGPNFFEAIFSFGESAVAWLVVRCYSLLQCVVNSPHNHLH